MAKSLVVSGDLPEKIDPFKESENHLLMVAFPKSPSKNFPFALAIAKQASRFAQAEIGGTFMYVAGFAKTPADASLAENLLGYVGSWKGILIFSLGHVVPYTYGLSLLLDCYLKSCMCRDTKAHCYELIDDPKFSRRRGLSLTISLEPVPQKDVEVKRYLFPCRTLLKDMKFQVGHPSSLVDQIHATAVRHGVYLCPRFDPDAFQECGSVVYQVDDLG